MLVKKIIILLLVVLNVSCVTNNKNEVMDALSLRGISYLSYILKKVIDGNTLILQKSKFIVDDNGDLVPYNDYENNDTITIGLCGIHAPKLDQPYGKEAKEFLQKFENKIVFYSYVDTGKSKDRLGALIYVDHSENNSFMVSTELVNNGLAWADKDIAVYKEKEQEVRKKKIGLWSQSNPIYPPDFKKTKKIKNNK
ncbi:MAG: thermonuclease family protein [Rickettsiales bacterium]|jgi:endonuclease YncB( thermonuclease family)|nr:thermonuclease family protein [Rickettsiales bacterium]